MPVSGQGREITAPVGLDEDAQLRRGDNLDPITPLIEEGLSHEEKMAPYFPCRAAAVPADGRFPSHGVGDD